MAGDIDATWAGYARFAGWPVPVVVVVVVAGNHEFDGRDLDHALPALRETCLRHSAVWIRHCPPAHQDSTPR